MEIEQVPKGPRPDFKYARRYTKPSVHPYDMVKWENRDATITDSKGAVIFEQKAVETPSFWSQTATNIVASKYFRGQLGTAQRETSVRQLIGRVAGTIATWGRQGKYFLDEEEEATFEAELTHILLYQMAAFNSPVWFNVGVEAKPQCSACQPYDSKVSTPFGMVRIGDIVTKRMTGLPVYDKDGITIVTNVKENGIKQVYRITLSNGQWLDATEDHQVLASKQRRSLGAWIPVKELQQNMKLQVHTDKQILVEPPAYLESIVPRPEAAIAGWLQGDGYVGQYSQGTNRSLTVEFQTATEDEFSYVKESMEDVFPGIHYHVTPIQLQNADLSYRKTRLYGEGLRPFVEKYQLLPKGHEAKAPGIIFTSGREAIRAYLRSLFQSDGYATRKNGRIGFSVISKELAADVQRLLLSLGIFSRLGTRISKRGNKKDNWVVDISFGSERQKFVDTVGFVGQEKLRKAIINLDQKKGKSPAAVRWENVESIEELGWMPVFDIQTESGNYLSENIVVHNCFINSVQDDMRSIMQLAMTEGMLFKYGSGTGSNLSNLRSSVEHLSTGGKASGPVSFMKGFDAFAGVIKSGGRTRRAAKMVILNAVHPDIMEFIWSKAKEEKKAWALIDAGYDPAVDGEAYGSVYFQNANHSVRVTDDFMNAVTEDKEWQTHYITNGKVAETYKARDMVDAMAEAAYICGDPGIQFDTTVNEWNPCSNTGRINASNPCSEYMFLDDSACNLASLNLMKFRTSDGEFDSESFKHAVEIVITAQEILVSNASYPTPVIERNSHDYRPLGMGYANLGALLMARGLPYDSDEGRNFAAAISALMSGHAYAISSFIAKRLGPFKGYAANQKPFLNVIGMHRSHAYKIPHEAVPKQLYDAATKSWDSALALGEHYGFKNAQISVIAPTGTIAFMMDCDTTGIEPDIALVKYKWLVGGGMIKIVNNTIPEGLRHLGYSEDQVKKILEHLEASDTIEGAPELQREHLPVFDCAFKPSKGTRSIHYMGHVKMMSAVQPFISGAISKTVNMPNNVTVKEIVQTYTAAWKMGLKAIAIYRDGSKRTQPLTTARDKEEAKPVEKIAHKPLRRRLPDEREAVIHKFSINGNEGYLTVGLYNDGNPGEMFVTMSKEGSTISGLMDAFATSISLALQYGVPLRVLVNKFVHTRFEPAGMTNNPEIRFAKSVIDYIFRWLGLKFLSKADQDAIGLTRTLTDTAETQVKLVEPQTSAPSKNQNVNDETVTEPDLLTFDPQSDAPACDNCGMIMVRSGSCYKCLNCGNTSGCG
jgi:ribonucleoside-diphosphate reductase alpha chain